MKICASSRASRSWWSSWKVAASDWAGRSAFEQPFAVGQIELRFRLLAAVALDAAIEQDRPYVLLEDSQAAGHLGSMIGIERGAARPRLRGRQLRRPRQRLAAETDPNRIDGMVKFLHLLRASREDAGDEREVV